MNIGRIILKNILANGYPRQNLALIHPEAREIDGIITVAGLGAITKKLDLLILAVDAARVPEMINDILKKKLAEREVAQQIYSQSFAFFKSPDVKTD